MKNEKRLGNWLQAFGKGHPLVIAGPCSAETESQVLTIAHQLKETNTRILRAGIWKPRTRPGNFEGVGALGLAWLQKAKEETGLLTATEVANPVHVELALKHDIDVLWIGARTTVSPFNVQEIAEALQGTQKIVLVKNPVNPDLSLWIGAVERFYEQGITNLGVIHRGFSSYKKNTYRNDPEWQIPIDLQNRFPDLPLLLDPSHIAGKRELVFGLCQNALDLNYNGFMIEAHYDPEHAWSDARQQITPVHLKEILQKLQLKKEISDNEEFNKKMANIRAKIDVLDHRLIEVLGDRMQLSEEIGELKRNTNVSILQSSRWQEILEKMTREGEEEGLSEEFVARLFKAIHQESINRQKEY